MTASFGETAARVCGAVSVLLGWRPSEFWDSTPAELTAVLHQLTPAAEAPDALLLEQLRRQFPDD